MRFVVMFLAVVLVVLIGALAYLVLQSCGVRVPFTAWAVSVCDTVEDRTQRDMLAAIDLQNSDLAQQIKHLERKLGTLHCKAEAPLPPLPDLKKPMPPSGLTEDAFDDNDIAVMQGCWELSSNYDVREINTGEITRFRYWQICFDANGNGHEEMRATNGVTCKGPLKGQLNDETLTMREPGKLQCSNDSSIFRRDITCRLNGKGGANCETLQPEINGRGAATLRRAGR